MKNQENQNLKKKKKKKKKKIKLKKKKKKKNSIKFINKTFTGSFPRKMMEH